MVNIYKIGRELKGKSKLEREAVLKQAVEYMTDNEKEAYKRFYEQASIELDSSSKVTSAVAKLMAQNNLFQPKQFFVLTYYLACAAAGKPIQTPEEVVAAARKRKKGSKLRMGLAEGKSGNYKFLSEKERRIEAILNRED